MLLDAPHRTRGSYPLGTLGPRTLLAVPPEIRRVPPPFEQIADHYATEIREGRLTAGEFIPANHVIQSTWSVSKATASKATDQLRRLGLVETVPGHGLRVVEQTPEQD